MTGPSSPYLKRNGGGNFSILWQEAGKTRKQGTGTPDRREAEKHLGRFLLGERPGGPAPGEAAEPDVTFAAIWPDYRDAARGTPTHARLFGLEARLLAAFGGASIISLDQDAFDAYAEARYGHGAALATVRLELTKVQAAVNHAIRRKVLPADAKLGVSLPHPGEARDRWLSTAEVSALIAAAGTLRGEDGRLTRCERFLWLAIATGARRRAIETLEWARVDLEAGVIHYKPDGIAQTTKHRPSVPISDSLREVLERAHRERQGDGQFVLDGTREVYSQVVRVAGLAGVRDVSPHVLRHTAATWMARKGVPIWKVAGVLGITVAMAEKVYAKHCPEGQREAVETIRF